jgi:hypothetical protein
MFVLAIAFVIVLVAFVASLVQLVPIWVTGWQGAHGHYPTGRLTYTVPDKWDTSTLTDIKYPDPTVWWSVFDDQVATWSPSYSWTPPDGARVALESGSSHGFTSIEAWYQNWAAVTDGSLGSGTVLPLADYTRVSLGGQPALCAASQEGSQMLPPHPPTSPHFDTVFAGYTPPYVGEAVVMCFALWHGQTYYLEVTVELHTASQNSDLRDAARMIESLRFT